MLSRICLKALSEVWSPTARKLWTNGRPAFTTATFHSLRLSVEAGRTDEARRELERILAGDRARWPLSSLNLLLALRARVARTFDEFLEYGPRVPSLVGYDDGGPGDLIDVTPEEAKRRPPGQKALDRDGARLLNEMVPLGFLRDAAKSAVLPVHLRQQHMSRSA